MKFFLRFIVFFALVLVSSVSFLQAPSLAAVQGIAAVVNDDVISIRDLEKRLKLVIGSSGLPNKAEVRKKLTPQVLGALINEKLMLQEAQKSGVEVNAEEIDRGFAQVAAQNKFKPEQFKKVLRQNGIDISTMRSQVESQLAWSKLVQKKLRPRVVISDRDVDDAHERITSKIGTKEYLTAEIFLPVLDPKHDNDARQLANRLVNEIKSGKASFFKLAQQFSGAAGASKGGDTGWVQETQIQEEALTAIKAVKKNQVTKPIKTLTGYHIYFLRDTRTLDESTVPSKEQIHYNLGTMRLEKLQSRHLLDIRAASFIDIRV